ncbi:MAG: Crp/Fnr family transcriptional regulator [Bacteroidales bacterium]|nr:Crp/Fnr family transcriptional regulator [Bacteroidales bacterium]
MDTNSMYDTLLGLPLFRGVSRDRISQVVGMTKFHFLKYLEGGEFIREREQCTHLTFMLSGAARVTVANDDRRFSVSQTLTAPNVLAPDCLFGLETYYPCSAVALEPTSILKIDKSDWLKILNSDEIFMLNYLNYLSMNAQKAVHGVLALTSGNLEERIAFWIIALTQPTATDIELQCRQRDLCSVFGVQRSTFTSTLESMKSRHLIDFGPASIKINDRRALLDLLVRSSE